MMASVTHLRTLRRIQIMLGLILLGMTAFVGWTVADRMGAFDPKPYWGVQLRHVAMRESGDVEVIADFTKGPCDLVKFAVVGVGANGVDPLDYSDLDERPEDDNRIVGDQTLRIVAHTSGETFRFIELRTRHTCDDETVDKTFARVDTIGLLALENPEDF